MLEPVVGAARVLLAGAVVAATAGGLALVVLDEPGAAPRQVAVATARATTSAATTASPQSAVGPVELSDRYSGCAVAAGYDPGGTQVLLWTSADAVAMPDTAREIGRPFWVKTGREVPAAVHGPCLEAIGGQDPGASSYGYAR